MGGQEATLARNIDASLEAVEEILGVLIEISRLDTGRLEPDITVFPLNEVFERLKVEFAPLAREKAARSAHRADTRVGALGPAAAAPRAAEPRFQRHQVHGHGQGAARRAPARRPAGDPGLRYRPRHPQVEARPHLQGVPAPGGDGEHGAGPRSRPVDRRAHRQGAGPSRSGCSRCRAAARPSRSSCRRPRPRSSPSRGRSWRPRSGASPVSPCCASTTSPPSCAACRRCSRAGAAA